MVTCGVENRGALWFFGRLNPYPVGVLLEMGHRHRGQMGGRGGCGRRILQITAFTAYRERDIGDNTTIDMVIPRAPAPAVFHAATVADRRVVRI